MILRTTPLEIVGTYIRAKDGNRPLLMRRVFAKDSELEMNVKTDAISFPSSVKGLEAISDVLVSRFAVDYENVFTFCLSKPSEADGKRFACHWLVGMSAKSDGAIRVGCGRYDWVFDPAELGLVEKLRIDIDVMNVCSKEVFDPIMDWLSGVPYPWCTPDEAAKDIPAIDCLAAVISHLKQLKQRR